MTLDASLSDDTAQGRAPNFCLRLLETPMSSDQISVTVQSVLSEVRQALADFIDRDENRVIDLSALPLSSPEVQQLLDFLGRGEVRAELSALGRSEIQETAFPGVWVVHHVDENGVDLGRFLEITTTPEILKTQRVDAREGLQTLIRRLENHEEYRNGTEIHTR